VPRKLIARAVVTIVPPLYFGTYRLSLFVLAVMYKYLNINFNFLFDYKKRFISLKKCPIT